MVDLLDRLRDIGGHVERNLVGDTLGETAADLLHRFPYRTRHLHGVGARQHVDIHHGRISSVDTALGAVRRGFERDAGHVPEADERSVGVGADDDLLEFADRRKASTGGDRDRDVEVRDGLLAQYACRRFAVLVLEGLLQVLHRQSEVGQPVGLHPDLHGVVAAADVRDAAHALHAAQHVQHVQRGVVRQVDFVELGVVRQQRDGHQAARSLLLDRNAVLNHLGRETCLGLLHAVLNFDGRQVGVRVDVEGDGGRKTARVAARRLHVEHSGGSVELLLDRRGDGLRHGLGAGAGIRGRNFHHRGHDARILVHGQQHQSEQSDDDDDDRENGREYGPVDKEIRFHGSLFFRRLRLGCTLLFRGGYGVHPVAVGEFMKTLHDNHFAGNDAPFDDHPVVDLGAEFDHAAFGDAVGAYDEDIGAALLDDDGFGRDDRGVLAHVQQ